jgi:hypothetical protein
MEAVSVLSSASELSESHEANMYPDVTSRGPSDTSKHSYMQMRSSGGRVVSRDGSLESMGLERHFGSWTVPTLTDLETKSFPLIQVLCRSSVDDIFRLASLVVCRVQGIEHIHNPVAITTWKSNDMLRLIRSVRRTSRNIDFVGSE